MFFVVIKGWRDICMKVPIKIQGNETLLDRSIFISYDENNSITHVHSINDTPKNMKRNYTTSKSAVSD
jgi:hypothetical protein